MKILVAGPYASPIIQKLVKNLRNHGHTVLLASHNINKAEEGVISLGQLKSFFSYLNFFKLNKIVKDFQPDIVHAHIVNHYGLMSLFQSKPLVVALWGSDVMLAPHSGKFIKKFIFRIINKLVMKRAARCHTSGFHVADEAEKQCKGVLKKTDVFYWGFPLEKPDSRIINLIAENLKNEFGIEGEGFIVFPRGLAKVYNPGMTAKIIKIILLNSTEAKKIIVLKGFANKKDEENFKSIIDIKSIIYIDRLLSSEELYYLYSKTNIHFSIPLSDSLGGGVIEPSLLGSIPILSFLPSYIKYAEENEAFILENFEESTIFNLILKIKKRKIDSSKKFIPLKFSTPEVIKNLEVCYSEALRFLPY